MKRAFTLASAIPDLEILIANSPMTPELRALAKSADFFATVQGEIRPGLRAAYKQSVTAATDPWTDVQYQSLYVTDMDPNDRIILQEPPVKDPMVGVMVLKAARLKGESGMVYCGTASQLKEFAAKLPEYEKRGEELDEKELIECLVDAAEADGLKIIYWRVSPEHGGSEEDDE